MTKNSKELLETNVHSNQGRGQPKADTRKRPESRERQEPWGAGRRKAGAGGAAQGSASKPLLEATPCHGSAI